MITRLFVFGTLKAGFPNFAINRGRRVPGRFRTEAAYPLFLVGERQVPWMLDAAGTGFAVLGELYDVDAPALREMDALERVGQPGGYVRQAIRVVAADIAGGVPLSVQAYLKPAHTLAPLDIRLGPLADYTLAHAARYRRRTA